MNIVITSVSVSPKSVYTGDDVMIAVGMYDHGTYPATDIYPATSLYPGEDWYPSGYQEG